METHHADLIWTEALALIAQRLNEGTFRIWFGPTAGLGFVDDTFLVGVTSDFARDWIQTRFSGLIQDSLTQVLGDVVQCRVVVSPELAQRIATSDPPPAGDPTRGPEMIRHLPRKRLSPPERLPPGPVMGTLPLPDLLRVSTPSTRSKAS